MAQITLSSDRPARMIFAMDGAEDRLFEMVGSDVPDEAGEGAIAT